MLYKSILFCCLLLFIGCKNVNNEKKAVINNDIKYSEKQFNLRWNIEKNVITNIPQKIKIKLNIICQDFNKYTLVKIETFYNDSVLGTFECRI